MQRLSPNEVSLNSAERKASHEFENLLSGGFSCIRAGLMILKRYPFLSVEYIEWLMGIGDE